MQKQKKSLEIEKFQKRMDEKIAEISKWTPGQLQKNAKEAVADLMYEGRRFSEAVNKRFALTPVPGHDSNGE